jgi:hypothetical protein
MTRLPRQWVASLALSLGLVVGGCVVGGCSRGPLTHLASDPPAEPEDFGQSPAAPGLFAVPAQLTALAILEPSPIDAHSQSVQAQYAQTASPPTAPPSQPIDRREESVYAPYVAARPSAPQQSPAASSPAQPMVGPPNLPHVSKPAVAERANDMTQRATQMARKGMHFAAKEELIQVLQFVAHARDAEERTITRTSALAAGFTALDEADDFASQGGSDPGGIRTGEIVRGHRTTILHRAGDFAPEVARQHYFAYAQQQLALAMAGEPAASQALYTLGKIQMAQAGSASQPPSHSGGRAIVFYQAALMVDSRNYQAANELGVLLAQDGQLTEARRALLHSVTVQPHVEGWQNLATVHRRLGEAELAQLADNERQLLARQQPATATNSENKVTWVDPKTFAAARGSDSGQSSPPARTAAAASSNGQLR